jgi:hypothetical protein
LADVLRVGEGQSFDHFAREIVRIVDNLFHTILWIALRSVS